MILSRDGATNADRGRGRALWPFVALCRGFLDRRGASMTRAFAGSIC